MKLLIPRQRIYIKSGDNYFFDEDTIQFITPSVSSSVMIRLLPTGENNIDIVVKLVDKKKRRTIVEMSSEQFVNMMCGYNADYEILGNDVTLLDGGGETVKHGDTLKILGKEFTFDKVFVDNVYYLLNKQDSMPSRVCNVILEDEYGRECRCIYKMIREDISDNDAFIVYDLQGSPFFKVS